MWNEEEWLSDYIRHEHLSMIGTIIQARMDSTRLPGKVLMTISDGMTMLDYIIMQLNYCKLCGPIVVATTHKIEDYQIVKKCRDLGVCCYVGEEDDVLNRYYQCAREYNFDPIIRLTGDNPFIDPTIVDDIISKYKPDYTTNTLTRTYCGGNDVEIFSFNTLERAWLESKSSYDREHVTPYMRNHPKLFKLNNVAYSSNHSRLSYSVDTIEDLRLVRRMADNMTIPILMKDVIDRKMLVWD